MKIIKLPLNECISRSFAYVFAHVDILLKFSLSWLVLVVVFDYLAGFQTLCTVDNVECLKNSWKYEYLIISYLTSIVMSVALIRKIILNESLPSTLRFGKIECKYMGWSLAFLIIVAFLSGIFGIIVTILTGQRGIAFQMGIIIALIAFIFCCRYILIFPATASENKEMTLKLSTEMTKGNIVKIILGFIVMAIPSAIAMNLLGTIFLAFRTESIMIKFCFSLLINMVGFFDAFLKASFMTHIYQYLNYVYHKQREE